MKKFYLFLLSLAMLSLQVSAYDFSSTSEGQFPIELYYAVNPDGKSVTVVQGPEAYACQSLEIPPQVTNNGTTYTVTAIGYQAFQKTNVKAVVLPNTVTTIQNFAFKGCTVASITFSTSLKTIGNNAFEGSQLTEVVLPDGVESIGNYAFAFSGIANRDEKLNRFVMPASVTSVGTNVLAYQRNLTELVLPDNLKMIPENAFYACSNLTAVDLPSQLEEIGSSAFQNAGLESVTFPSSLKKIGSKGFSGNRFKTLVLPDNITSLGESAFASCTNLQSIAFSNGLTELPQHVCSYCDQLTEVNIPGSVRKIGIMAFDHCTRLTHIDLPESVTELAQGVFGNSGLTSFTFPSKLSRVGAGVFSSCPDLTEITIPPIVATLGNSTFRDCTGLVKVTLPETMDSIPEGTFEGCTALKEINIPGKATFIGGSAFNRCTALTSLTLPHTLKTIGGSALNYTGLTEVTLPHSLKEIGAALVGNCASLTALHMQSAIVPRVIDWTGYIIGPTDGLHCTLYVPAGSKESYAAAESWRYFKAIVEEEADPNTLYRVTTSRNGGGTIRIDDATASVSQSDVKLGSRVTLTLVPDDGYRLQSLTLNGEDVTDGVADGQYVIEAIAANADFNAVFTRMPVTLRVRSGQGGTTGLSVAYHERATLILTPDDGWRLNSVYLGNSDVTADVTADGTYTTPALGADTELSIAFEQTTGIDDTEALTTLKARTDASGRLTVDGVPAGQVLTVVTAEGKRVATMQAGNGRATCQLPQPGVYVVRAGRTAIKVGY